jgi:hypothetical protein
MIGRFSGARDLGGMPAVAATRRSDADHLAGRHTCPSTRSRAHRVEEMRSRALLALLSLLLALAAVEAFVRAADLPVASLHRGLLKLSEIEVLHPERNLLTGPAGYDTDLFGHGAHFNSLGMRDVEPVVPKPAGTKRILLLGDSMVFGQGVATGDMAASRMRTELAGQPVDVVSAGIPGWNTLEEEQFLLEYADRITPDIVALVYVQNDNEPVDPFQRARRPSRSFSESLHRALLLHSRAFEWAAYVYRSRIAGPDPDDVANADKWMALVGAQGAPYSDGDAGWKASRDALLRVRDGMGERGGDLVVFVFDMGTIAEDAPMYRRLDELVRSEGLRVVRTRPFFADHNPESLMNAPGTDAHPNAEGQRLLADGIVAALREQGLLTR